MGHRHNDHVIHDIQKRRQTKISGLYSRQVTQIIAYSYKNLPYPAIKTSNLSKDQIIKKNTKLLPLTRTCLSGNLVLDNLELDPKKANSEQSEDAKQCTPQYGVGRLPESRNFD